ncbi:hypothetical protein [Erythrobacter sp. HL-111]|uniref:hypothetical protein n=1 Tax=Erythrobacter sp. HL-111 TaxID=1798193 RepID=UPI000B7F4EDE|nr:hypothetical protein [Erythrobacter sp. HL-111]
MRKAASPGTATRRAARARCPACSARIGRGDAAHRANRKPFECGACAARLVKTSARPFAVVAAIIALIAFEATTGAWWPKAAAFVAVAAALVRDARRNTPIALAEPEAGA